MTRYAPLKTKAKKFLSLTGCTFAKVLLKIS